jgi:hypothetical protein
MMHVLALVAGLICVGLMFELLRRRQLKEKYAALWLLVGIVMLGLAAWPPLLNYLARLTGVKSGPSLLLFVATLVLILVSVHLSWEVSRLEDKSRALAEEIGLLRLEVEQLALSHSARSLADEVVGSSEMAPTRR